MAEWTWLRADTRTPEDDRRESRRRRVVVLVTTVVTAPMLRTALTRPSGSRSFLGWTVSLATTMAGGAVLSGPLHVGRSHRGPGRPDRVPVTRPLAVGAAAVAVFSAGGAVAATIPALRTRIDAVIRHARFGYLSVVVPLTVVTGAAEELFYRGALYAALPPDHRVWGSTAVYGAVTCATGNPMLVGAAVLLGGTTALARRATGGVLSPAIIHAIWSCGMIAVLPPLVRLAPTPATYLDALTPDNGGPR